MHTAAGVAGGRRLEGIDVARALAFGGMLLAHFATAFYREDPGWLQAFDNAADGRAAPLFALLLGVGAGILVARRSPDRVLVARGLALAAIGLAVWPFVDRVYLILPHYGLLLAAVPLLRRLPSPALLAGAALAFLTPSVVTAVVDGHGLRTTPQPDSYGALLDVGAVLGHIVWSGGYPLVGWTGFALVGLWVARLPVAQTATQVRMLVGGAAVAALQPAAAVAFAALGGVHERPDAGGWSTFFDSTAHSNRTAWYVLATASAVAVVGACLLLTPLLARSLRPVVALGQMALTAYLAHIALGAWLVWDWVDDTAPPLVDQVAVVAAVFGGFAAGAWLWRRRWKRGPLEGLVRWVAAAPTAARVRRPG